MHAEVFAWSDLSSAEPKGVQLGGSMSMDVKLKKAKEFSGHWTLYFTSLWSG